MIYQFFLLVSILKWVEKIPGYFLHTQNKIEWGGVEKSGYTQLVSDFFQNTRVRTRDQSNIQRDIYPLLYSMNISIPSIELPFF